MYLLCNGICLKQQHRNCVPILCIIYDKSYKSVNSSPYTCIQNSQLSPVLTQLGVNQHKIIYNTQILKLYTLHVFKIVRVRKHYRVTLICTHIYTRASSGVL